MNRRRFLAAAIGVAAGIGATGVTAQTRTGQPTRPTAPAARGPLVSVYKSPT